MLTYADVCWRALQTVLRIGFLNDKLVERRDEYLSLFDLGNQFACFTCALLVQKYKY
jgi:hypothetical protein